MFPDGSMESDPFDGSLSMSNTFDNDQLSSQLLDSVKQEPTLAAANCGLNIKQELSLAEQLSIVSRSITTDSFSTDTSLVSSLTETPNISLDTLDLLGNTVVSKPPVVNISHPSSAQLQQAALKLQRQAQLVAQKKQLLQLQQQQQKQQQAQLLQQQIRLILEQAGHVAPKPQPQPQPQIQQLVAIPQQVQQTTSQVNIGQLNLQQLQQVF